MFWVSECSPKINEFQGSFSSIKDEKWPQMPFFNAPAEVLWVRKSKTSWNSNESVVVQMSQVEIVAFLCQSSGSTSTPPRCSSLLVLEKAWLVVSFMTSKRVKFHRRPNRRAGSRLGCDERKPHPRTHSHKHTHSQTQLFQLWHGGNAFPSSTSATSGY